MSWNGQRQFCTQLSTNNNNEAIKNATMTDRVIPADSLQSYHPFVLFCS